MNTFKDYLNEPCSLNFEALQSLHEELLNEIGSDNEAIELYNDLVDAATRYAVIRAGWNSLSPKEKSETDARRTAAHNKLIIHFNMLARYLRTCGKPASWRERLGNEEENPYARKTIGDFGCYIVFVSSLMAR